MTTKRDLRVRIAKLVLIRYELARAPGASITVGVEHEDEKRQLLLDLTRDEARHVQVLVGAGR